METYGKGDRFKIRDGRGKRANEEEGGCVRKWTGKENTELSGNGDRCSGGRCRGEDGGAEGRGWPPHSACECGGEFGRRRRAELVDEHGKAFTESGLSTPRTLRAFRGVPRDTAAAAAD